MAFLTDAAATSQRITKLAPPVPGCRFSPCLEQTYLPTPMLPLLSGSHLTIPLSSDAAASIASQIGPSLTLPSSAADPLPTMPVLAVLTTAAASLDFASNPTYPL